MAQGLDNAGSNTEGTPPPDIGWVSYLWGAVHKTWSSPGGVPLLAMMMFAR